MDLMCRGTNTHSILFDEFCSGDDHHDVAVYWHVFQTDHRKNINDDDQQKFTV